MPKLKEPKKPYAPYKPHKPKEPEKQVSKILDIPFPNDIQSNSYSTDCYECGDETFAYASSTLEEFDKLKQFIEDQVNNLKEASDIRIDFKNGAITYKTKIDNSEYEKELKVYNTTYKRYLKKLDKYNKEYSKYKEKLATYNEEYSAYKKIMNEEHYNNLKKQLAKLEKEISS